MGLKLTIKSRRDFFRVDIQNEVSTIVSLLPLQLGVLLNSRPGGISSCGFDRTIDTIRADSCSSKFNTNASSTSFVIVFFGS